MRYLFSIVWCLFLVSCIDTRPKETFKVTYEFERLESLSKKDLKQTSDVVLFRLQKLGVEDAAVGFNKKQQITIEATTHIDVSKINAVITNPGDLSFWPLHKPVDLMELLNEVDTMLKQEDAYANSDLFLGVVNERSMNGAPQLFYIKSSDETLVKSIFNREDVKALFAENEKQIKLLFGLVDDNGLVPVYAAAINQYRTAPITEENITNAREIENYIGRPAISIEMDKVSARKWEQITGEAYEKGSQIAIVLNDRVYSAPGVTSGPITGGMSEISGNFTMDEVEYMTTILNSGRRIPKLEHVKTLNLTDKE
jgi:SecD/SecF fusion protein